MAVDHDDLHYISQTRSRLVGKSYHERVQILKSAATGAPNRGVKRRIDRMLHVEQSKHGRKVFAWFVLFLVLAGGSVFVMAKFGNHDSATKKSSSSSSSTRVVMMSSKAKKHKKAKKSTSSSTSSSSSVTSSSTSSSSSSSVSSRSTSSSSSSVASSSSSSSSSSRRSSSSSKKVVASSSSTATKYTIREGDNLYRIAAKNHMTLAKLESLNGLKDDANLQPGQTIRLK